MAPTPITIVTGFLGSGKTTLILNLIPQLPKTYKLALLKNEFGDLAIDSQLATSSSISGVRELLNGCICCNLVGQLGDALETLRSEQQPDRIIIETSGSAFPATLALEVNRLIDEANGENFVLDGVVSVIDVENWQGYEDTSVTAKMQAKYTDLVVFNKWEDVGERRFDECLDRLGDLEIQTPYVKSDKGRVDRDLVLGIDGSLAHQLDGDKAVGHDHPHDHQQEVEVFSVRIDMPTSGAAGLDLDSLHAFLTSAPKDEIYRIKAVLFATSKPQPSTGPKLDSPIVSGQLRKYILNWAFGRWTVTEIGDLISASQSSDGPVKQEPALRMTVICARYESTKWKKRLESENMLRLDTEVSSSASTMIERVV